MRPAQPQVVVVPGPGIGMGMGAGYYDRTFQNKTDSPLIGVAYQFQEKFVYLQVII